MCGIAGYFGKVVPDRDAIEKCLTLMHRRGPNACSSFVHNSGKDRHVALLHSRLSIIDLDDRANQPFQIGSKVLVYNGELYNYLELKKELGELGHQFITESDTEVLLRILIQYGWEGLRRCEGMWAFALYDKEDHSLLLSRDAFGEKPLYFHRAEKGFYFGSEIKFLAKLSGIHFKTNHQHLYRYLVNGYKSLYKGKDTFFHGVEELPRATVLKISADGQVTTHQYWEPEFKPEDSMTYDEAVQGVRESLIESIRLRLRADVPLAFCMSGGVDSNTLISVAKKILKYDVHGFTILNSDPRYNEQPIVEAAVRELGIRHTAVPVTTEHFLRNLKALVRQHDAPVYTITYYAHWLLMGSVAQGGYHISISGTGADELFTGYYDHHNAYLYEVRKDAANHRAALEAWTKYIKPEVRNPFLGNPDLFVENPSFRDHIFLNAEDFAKYLKDYRAESFTEESYCPGLLRNRMCNEMFHEIVPPILHEDDLNSMYFSIENRSPFLDRRLFEFSNRIPTRHLIRDGAAKAILRDSMRGIVPSAVLDQRKKVGFNAPILSFLNPEDSEVRDYLLDQSPIFDHVKRDCIESLISKKNLPNSESKFLFYFLNAKMFLEEFEKPKAP
jgi:asparagine synthase (glutamine-hydrolysing)